MSSIVTLTRVKALPRQSLVSSKYHTPSPATLGNSNISKQESLIVSPSADLKQTIAPRHSGGRSLALKSLRAEGSGRLRHCTFVTAYSYDNMSSTRAYRQPAALHNLTRAGKAPAFRGRPAEAPSSRTKERRYPPVSSAWLDVDIS